MKSKKVLLAILAHPDDETFGMGGTLAYYANLGVEVILICATRGEAGEVNRHYLQGYRSIAELRTAELECAAKQLGISKVIYLNHLDSGLPGSVSSRDPQALVNIPDGKLAEEIIRVIRIFHPQVVITHDPIGGYMHPDHIKLHQAVNEAFMLAGDPDHDPKGLPVWLPDKLYYNSISRTILRWLVWIMPMFGKDPGKFGQNGDIDLRSIVRANIPIHTRINYSKVKKQREAASRCHASQGGKELNKGVAGLLRGWHGTQDVFMKGYPRAISGYIESDLFEGIQLKDD